jgi:hypothetical protein
MKSLVPYLNERNVVANMPVPDIIWDHPDRETNPLASAPGEMIFSKVQQEEKIQINQKKESNFFKTDVFFDLNQNVKNTKKPESPNVFAKSPNNEPNYLNMYKAESEKNILLENQNKELRLLLEQKKVRRNLLRMLNPKNMNLDGTDRHRYEALINDLRGQNERLSNMLKKKPIHSVVQKHVIGRKVINLKISNLFSKVKDK